MASVQYGDNIWSKYFAIINKASTYFPDRFREDLVQEGLISLDKICKSFNPDKGLSLESYVYICVRRTMTSAFVKLIDHEPLCIDDVNDEELSVEYDYIEKQYIEQLFEDIRKQLSDIDNRVLDMYLEDKTYSEIASELGITEKRVDNILYKIKNKLKKY